LAIAFFNAEWWLFELVRAPYRPPYDMSTFLGTEKYAVMQFMAVLAFGWLCTTIFLTIRFRFNARDYIVYAGLILGMTGAIALAVFYPNWPVTPLERILH
jgi:hypothetical protein